MASGNFTKNAAFTMNTEATVLVSDADANATVILKSALATINGGWSEAESVHPTETGRLSEDVEDRES